MRKEIKPILTKPVDFEHFWRKTREELLALPLSISYEPTDTKNQDCTLTNISFLSLENQRIHGYALQWNDSQPRPLIVHAHGYMSQTEVRWEWAQQGFNIVGVDIRGFGRSRTAVPNPSQWGYVLTGIESPEQSVLRGAVCDYIQAVRVAQEICAEKASRLVLQGMSFAGGLALMAEYVLQAADLLVLGVPTFGWAEGRKFFAQSGSGQEINRFLKIHPEYEEDTMLVLRYFDPVNFASYIQCPTLVGVGIKDPVVPAYTVYAIANHLSGPHEIMEFPVSHTDLPEEQHWKKFEEYWIQLAQKSISQDFGKTKHKTY
ncbi:MAG: acetylxylan esterase [Bacteroidota bacterium]